jgi:hypothetical protein
MHRIVKGTRVERCGYLSETCDTVRDQKRLLHMGMKISVAVVILLCIGDPTGQVTGRMARAAEYDFTKTILKICGKTVYYDTSSVDACSPQNARASNEVDKCDYYYLYRDADLGDGKCYEGTMFPYGGARVFFTPGRIEEWHSSLFEARKSFDAFMAEEDARNKQKQEEERVKAAKANRQQQEKLKKFLAGNPGCQVLIKEMRWGVDGKFFFAEGNVTNLTQSPLIGLKVLVEWKSKGHISLGSASTYLDYGTLLSGQTCRFGVRQSGANPQGKYISVFIFDQSNQPIKFCVYD